MEKLEEYGIFKEKKRNYEGMLYVMALIHNALERRFASYFSSCGTSAPKYNILLAVAYINGGRGLNQKELGRHLVTSPGNVTKLVESLCGDGLVSRVQNRQSRRENIVRITPKGQRFIDKVWPGYDAMAGGFADMLSGADQKRLIGILEKWFLAIDASGE